jgi:hypothetical protein
MTYYVINLSVHKIHPFIFNNFKRLEILFTIPDA